MKEWKDTTMPVLKKIAEVPFEQSILYNQLVEILKPYAKWFNVKVDTFNQYELWTEHPYRTISFKPKAKRGVLFAGVVAYKKHIGFYFYPLHINEALKECLQTELKTLLRGSSTFHFNTLPDSIAIQLKKLLKDGWEFYNKRGWIIRRN